VLLRASQAGVERMVTIATDVEDARAAIALCRRHPQIRCAIGIHPNYAHQQRIEDVQVLSELQSDAAVVALGEMGLDYFHRFCPVARQREFFIAQLALAEKLNRPVVIHSREAIDDTLAIMRDFPRVRAVFHSFTGSSQQARRVIEQGYLIGFTGPVTFKKNDALRAVVEACPVDRILVETDAPYLTPEPMRKQKTNEPSMVVHTARVVAELHRLSYEAFRDVHRRTAEGFFA
jgi:TatD DNase family protein